MISQRVLLLFVSDLFFDSTLVSAFFFFVDNLKKKTNIYKSSLARSRLHTVGIRNMNSKDGMSMEEMRKLIEK